MGGTGLPFLGICSEHNFPYSPLSTTKNPGHHLQTDLRKLKSEKSKEENGWGINSRNSLVMSSLTFPFHIPECVPAGEVRTWQ